MVWVGGWGVGGVGGWAFLLGGGLGGVSDYDV